MLKFCASWLIVAAALVTQVHASDRPPLTKQAAVEAGVLNSQELLKADMAKEYARLQRTAVLESVWIPVLSLNYKKSEMEQGVDTPDAVTSALTQASPFGTNLSVQYNSGPSGTLVSPRPSSKQVALTLSQSFLKDGFISGGSISLDIAATEIEIQKSLYLEKLNNLILDIVSAYDDVYFSTQELEVNQVNYEEAQKQFDLVMQGIERGVMAPTERYIAEEDKLLNEIEVSEARERLLAAKRKLATLVFADPVLTDFTVPDEPSLNDGNRPSLDLKTNERLRSRRLLAEQSELKTKLEQNHSIPDLRLFASKYYAADSGVRPRDYEPSHAVFGVSLTTNLDFGIRRSSVKQKAIEAESARLDADAFALDLQKQFASLASSLDSNRNAQKLFEGLVEATRMRLETEKKKLGLGLTTLKEVVEVQREFVRNVVRLEKHRVRVSHESAALKSLQCTLHEQFAVSIR